MTGLERNSGAGAVLAAAYAPLFVATTTRPWFPSLICFDQRR